MNLFTKLIFVNFADWISPWHRLFTGRLGAQIQGELEVWEDTVMEILRDSPVQSIRCWVWTDNECLQGTCINYKWLKRNCPKFITEQLWIRNTIQPLRRQMWPFKFNGSHSFHTRGNYQHWNKYLVPWPWATNWNIVPGRSYSRKINSNKCKQDEQKQNFAFERRLTFNLV